MHYLCVGSTKSLEHARISLRTAVAARACTRRVRSRAHCEHTCALTDTSGGRGRLGALLVVLRLVTGARRPARAQMRRELLVELAHEIVVVIVLVVVVVVASASATCTRAPRDHAPSHARTLRPTSDTSGDRCGRSSGRSSIRHAEGLYVELSSNVQHLLLKLGRKLLYLGRRQHRHLCQQFDHLSTHIYER
jgi:hypothetical protein